MSFGKTRDALSIFEKQDKIAVEDLLGFFLDFCDDIGVRPEELPVRDPAAYLKNTRKSGRILQDILNSRDLPEMKREAAERLEQLKEKLAVKDALLSAEVRELEASGFSGIEDNIRANEQKRAALLSEQNAREQRLSELSSENEKLDVMIASQDQKTAALLLEIEQKNRQNELFEQHMKSLEQTLSETEQKNSELAYEINHHLNPSAEAAKETAAVYQAALEKTKAELERLTAENEGAQTLIDDISQKIEAASAEKEAKTQRINSITEQYDAVRKELDVLTSRMPEAERMEQELKKAVKAEELLKEQSTLIEKLTGVKPFSVEQTVAGSLEYAENVIRKLQLSMKNYQTEINSRLNS